MPRGIDSALLRPEDAAYNRSAGGPGIWLRAIDTIELSEIKPYGMWLIEDFLEAPAALASTVIAKAHWTGAGTNGTQTVTANPNGTMVLATTATSSSTSTLTFTQQLFSMVKNPSFEALLQVNNVTANLTARMGLYASASNWAYVKYDTALSTTGLYLSTNNNGAGEVATLLTGYPGAPSVAVNTYFKIRIEILPQASGATTAGMNVWINDIQVPPALLPATQLIQSPLTTLAPYFYLDNKAAAQANTMTIDYAQFSQNR